MKKQAAFLMAVVLLALASMTVLAASPPAKPDPGCASGTTYTVSHSWWTEKGEAFPGRHIHLGACVPLHQTLSGSSLIVDTEITLHNNPGAVNWVRGCWNSECPASGRVVFSTPKSCAIGCTFPVRLNIPFEGRRGWYELRLTANINSNVFKDRQFESTRYPMRINSTAAKPSSGEGGRTGWAGWYHDKYQNVYIDEAAAQKLERGQPINLPFTFQAKGDFGLIVAVDANSHASDPGLVLGSNTTNSWKTYTIPAGLTPGWHALFMRTEQVFSDGKSAGQGEIWFKVP